MTAPGEVNALGALRKRLGVEPSEVAQRLGIKLSGVATLETTPLRLLEVDAVDRYVSALGCRLDLVAVHIDGESIWLSDDGGAS